MTDKGLRKAVKGQTTFRLPSNFTYRMMQQVSQEALAREKREERRWFIFICAISAGSLASIIVFIGSKYGDIFTRLWHNFLVNIPDTPPLSSFLPMLVALLCLCWLYRWLEKKIQNSK